MKLFLVGFLSVLITAILVHAVHLDANDTCQSYRRGYADGMMLAADFYDDQITYYEAAVRVRNETESCNGKHR